VFVITGLGSHKIAIESLGLGAIGYIEKPLRKDDLSVALGRVRENLADREELSYKAISGFRKGQKAGF